MRTETTTPLPSDWMEFMSDEFEKDYMKNLKTFLRDEISGGKTIYPHGSEIFSAFNLTPLDEVKVVIIGQDPYHGPGQAHGLCFSVKPGVRVPPSLKNIYKELQSDLDFKVPDHGFLEHWAKEGVLLLNNVLTVEKSKAAAHKGRGWEEFTDRTVEVLNRDKEGLVFILWGSHAQTKGQSLDRNKHLVLECPHPSPFSANRGFFGCKHFSKTNEYLRQRGKKPVNWQLPLSVN